MFLFKRKEKKRKIQQRKKLGYLCLLVVGLFLDNSYKMKLKYISNKSICCSISPHNDSKYILHHLFIFFTYGIAALVHVSSKKKLQKKKITLEKRNIRKEVSKRTSIAKNNNDKNSK